MAHSVSQGIPLRYATKNDLERISVVAAAGFSRNEVFAFERPNFCIYPEDTLRSYYATFASLLQDSDCTVVVATAEWSGNENGVVDPAIYQFVSTPTAPEEVVVGVAAWKVHRGHGLDVENQDEDAGIFNGRDVNAGRRKRVNVAIQLAKNKHFARGLELEMLVVHPAYWRRGFGTELVEWGRDLARQERVVQGVVASSSGEGLCARLGFEKVGWASIEGDTGRPEGLSLAVMIFDGNVAGDGSQ